MTDHLPPKTVYSPNNVDDASHGRDNEFLTIVALLMAIAVLAINMILPAFEQITRQFGLMGTARVGLTVSLLYLGLSLGQIILGPISDSIGRRNALTIGMLVFLAGCMISGLSTSFEILIVGQVVQGIGLGAPRVITLAILRDRYSGDAMARAMSFVMMIFVVAPTFAPFIGQSIVTISGWRSLFGAYGLLGLGLLLVIRFRLPETHPKSRRQAFNLATIADACWSVLKNKETCGYAIALGVASGPFIAYLNRSQQIFEFQYELGKLYPILFASLSLWIGGASFVNGKVVQRIGAKRLVLYALATTAVASLIAIGVLAILGANMHLTAFVIYMGIVLFCVGILVSNLNALAMGPIADAAGTGAAFVGALATVISVPVAIGIGEFADTTAISIPAGFAVCSTIALCIHLLLQRK